MWRKIISMALMVAFLVAITGPVSGHDGIIRIPSGLDPGGDEHPWGGGEHSENDGSVIIATTNSVPTITDNFFIDYAITRYWTAFSSSVRNMVMTSRKDAENRNMKATNKYKKDMRNR